MSIVYGLLWIGLGACCIRYRESIGDTLGEPAWAEKVGGIYNVLVIAGVFFCFWGIATMTGTTDILFGPLVRMLPGAA